MKPGVISLFAIFLGTSSPLAQPMPYKSEDCSGYTVQTEMIACAERNYEAADAALNQLFRQVLDSEHNPTARSRLVAEERTWVIMKEKRCAAEAGPREKGGKYLAARKRNLSATRNQCPDAGFQKVSAQLAVNCDRTIMKFALVTIRLDFKVLFHACSAWQPEFVAQ